MKSRYLNEITISLLAVSAITFLASGAFMTFHLKALSAAYAQHDQIPLSLPALSVRSDIYDQTQYQDVVKRVSTVSPVKIEVTATGITISAPTIANEIQWRSAITETLALDSNLKVLTVCGSSNNACTGVALLAEIVGQRQKIIVSH